jgi:hypothetical protein
VSWFILVVFLLVHLELIIILVLIFIVFFVLLWLRFGFWLLFFFLVLIIFLIRILHLFSVPFGPFKPLPHLLYSYCDLVGLLLVDGRFVILLDHLSVLHSFFIKRFDSTVLSKISHTRFLKTFIVLTFE